MLVQRTLVCSIALAAALGACSNRPTRAQQQAQAQQAQAQAQAILNQQQAQMAALQAQQAQAQARPGPNGQAPNGQAPNALAQNPGQPALNQAALQGNAAVMNAQMAAMQAMQAMQNAQNGQQQDPAQMQAAANQAQLAQMQAQAAMQNGMQAAAQALNQANQQLQQMGSSRGARPIALGQTITGALTQTGSQTLSDGSLGDDYQLTMAAGQQATIVLRGGPTLEGGGNLDVYEVVYFNGTEVGHDDDSAGNLNSRFLLSAAMPGVYTIRATTFGGGIHQGSYTMSVLPGALPTAQ